MSWDLLINNIRLILDRHYSMKNYTNAPAKANWISNEIFKLMKQRDNLYKRAKITKDEILWQEAKRLRNLIGGMCKKAKTEFISNKIADNQSNPKKFWNKIGKIWNNNKDNNSSGIDLIDPQDGSLKSGPAVREIFNNYFSQVGENLYNAIPTLSSSEQACLNSTMNLKATGVVNSIFKFRPITLIELERHIKKIEIHKNSGIDNISSHLLKLKQCYLVQKEMKK